MYVCLFRLFNFMILKIWRNVGLICTKLEKLVQKLVEFALEEKKIPRISKKKKNWPKLPRIKYMYYRIKYGYFWKLPFWVRVSYIRKTYGTFLQFRSIYYEVTS
jgi:hypothetical protein